MAVELCTATLPELAHFLQFGESLILITEKEFI